MSRIVISESPPPLDASQVHVWFADPRGIREKVLDEYRSFLDEGETGRLDRFRFARDRRSYLVAHGLTRAALSHYEDRPPESWRFVTNEHGRPEPHPELGSRLRFNISHTDGAVACAVAIDRDIGVDVERAPSASAVDELAAHAFSSSERKELAELADDAQVGRFLQLWTVKEAYIKARGLGLTIPLDAFSISIGEPITIRFGSPIQDEPEGWQLEQLWVSADRSLAVAIPRSDADLEVVVVDPGSKIVRDRVP